MLKSLLAALVLVAALAPSALADDFETKLGGVIAVEQSRTPGISDAGVVLIRPLDATFVSNDEWGLGGFPEFSPDGRTLTTAHEGCLWFTHVLVGHLPNFTESACRFGSEPRYREPTWSPDGRRVAFIGETGTGQQETWDMYVMNADETGVRQITTDGRLKSDPQWRIDGRIAFVEDGDVRSVSGDALTGSVSLRETTGLDASAIAYPRLAFGTVRMAHISRPDSFAVPDRLFVEGREVLSRPHGSLRGLAWEPADTPNHLVVAIQAGGDSELLVIDRAGRTVRVLPVSRPGPPDWGVDRFADSPAGGAAPGPGAGDPRDPDPQPPRRRGGRQGARSAETRVDRKGRVPLQLGCPRPVTCKLAVGGRVVTGRRGGLALPVRRYRVPARTTRRVRYRLPAPARRLLRKRGQLRVRFTITGTRRQVRALTLRRR